MPEPIQSYILVDDDASIRNLLSEYIAENGICVSTAEPALWNRGGGHGSLHRLHVGASLTMTIALVLVP